VTCTSSDQAQALLQQLDPWRMACRIDHLYAGSSNTRLCLCMRCKALQGEYAAGHLDHNLHPTTAQTPTYGVPARPRLPAAKPSRS
jgi:hypothetical protein